MLLTLRVPEIGAAERVVWLAAAAAVETAAPLLRGAPAPPPTRHDDRVALDARFVRHQAVDVQHDARAAVRLGDVHGVEHALLHVDAARSHRDGRVGQIERDARRIVDGERERRRRVIAEPQRQLDLVAGARW